MSYRFKTATPPNSPIGHAIIPKYKNANKRRADSTVDSQVKYCEKCKKCWELVYLWDNNSKGRKKLASEHYIDFPSIGKKRQTCYTCKEDPNGQL